MLTQSIGTALASGQFNRVPVIIGTNHDEWRLFVGHRGAARRATVTAANYQAMIANTLGVPAAAAAAIAAEYPLSAYPSPPVALGAVGTDAIFACPALTAEESLSPTCRRTRTSSTTRTRRSCYLPPVSFPYGAAHASEIQYLFALSNVVPAPLTSGGPAAARRGHAAATGPTWPSRGPRAAAGPGSAGADPQWLSLVPPRPQLETNFAAEHHCAFWIAAEASR